MNRLVMILLLVAPFLMMAQSQPQPKKILMVVSSYGKDNGASRPGYEFDEFSQAYLIFKNNGLVVDVASPKGGKVEADKFKTEKPYNQQVMEDESAMASLAETKPTSSIDPAAYDAIYIVGGKGAMFDLPYDPSLQDIILDLYRREGTVISSVCHGPASFVNIKDGEDYIIKDVEITSFCNTEEALFGKKWVPEFPFQLEDQLVARGAVFSQTDFMLSNVAVSGKFITGQNPFSTTRSAEAVVRALGQEPVARELYKDERSAYLIQEMLDGEQTPATVSALLEKDLDAFEIPLIAVYGYYKIMQAKEDHSGLSKAVELIEITAPHFFNENLQMVLARTHIKLNNADRAREILNELIEKDLLKDQAETLLKEIG